MFFVFAATSDIGVDQGYAFFDNVAVYAEEAMIYATPRSGELAVGESEEVTLVVDTDGLRPGPYVAVADVILTGQDALASYATSHLLFFDVINQMPMAVDDTLGVVAGGVYPLSALLDAALGNDVDADGDTLAILDVTEPVYGDLRRTGFDGGAQYVAPRNYDGYDYFEYLVTDGYDVDTARVVLAVMARPEFVTGVQQQFTLIEGDSLTLNTMRLAAGVGGLDEDVVVWAETDEEDLNIAWDFDANTLTFWADEGWFGQAPATLYVADRNNLGAPYDALDVTVVVAPLDNIRITIVVVVEGASVAFAAEEREASEAAITAWRWDCRRRRHQHQAQPDAHLPRPRHLRRHPHHHRRRRRGGRHLDAGDHRVAGGDGDIWRGARDARAGAELPEPVQPGHDDPLRPPGGAARDAARLQHARAGGGDPLR